MNSKYHDDPIRKPKLIRLYMNAYLKGPGRRVVDRLDKFFDRRKNVRGRMDRRRLTAQPLTKKTIGLILAPDLGRKR